MARSCSRCAHDCQAAVGALLRRRRTRARRQVIGIDLKGGRVQCRCLNSAKLGERKNCNLPGVIVDLPTLTEKDTDDLVNWGVKNSVDFIAASFVRKASDIAEIRAVLAAAARDAPPPPNASNREWGSNVPTGIRIIAKVENQEGLANFDEILEAADGIMVARGDLGMEIPLEKANLPPWPLIPRRTGSGAAATVPQSVRSAKAAHPPGTDVLGPEGDDPKMQPGGQAGCDSDSDAGQHDHKPAADARGGDGRGQCGAGRDGLRHAVW